MKSLLLATVSCCVFVGAARAESVTVAVASNFLPVAEQIATDFERVSGYDVVVSHGSTGQIYALIVNGAPIDIFLSADRERPFRLLEDGVASEIRTYARGRLVLVSDLFVDVASPEGAFKSKKVALADPTLAPYGLAATASMESMGLDTADFQPLLVANVSQAANLFVTGNAEIAFVSASLLPLIGAPFEAPLDGLHPPIRQDGAFLDRASGNPAAEALWDYLFSEEARPRIRAGGYELP